MADRSVPRSRAITEEELRRIGPHERIHVQQYERWGIFFFAAYAASSAWHARLVELE